MVNKYEIKCIKKGGNGMRTLEEIRKQNKRPNMFFDGMEEKPVELPPETIRAGREFFENVVKPTVRRTLNKQLAEGNI